jgi:hypothetical protein
MKWFVYLFSLYILLLSGVPCNANDDCCMDEIAQTTASNKQTGNSDHKPVCPCSPFFACGACHGAVVPNIIIEFSKNLPPVTRLQYFYTVQPLFNFPSSIWQPPKMV